MHKATPEEIRALIEASINGEGEHVTVTMESSAKNIMAWDSLAQLMIISALDEELGDSVNNITALSEATSVDGIITVLREHDLCA